MARGRKITEGLRLGDASTCRKIGNFELKMVRKLVTTDGADQLLFEGASPPHNQVRQIKYITNPLATKDRLENLEIRGFVRKDVIGSWQEEMARPGMLTNGERCDKGPGQVTGQASQAAAGLAIGLRQPYE